MIKKSKNHLYMNNEKLKAASVKIDFTKEQLSELVKCKSDPVYFIEKYVKILTLNDGVIPFKMWDFQKDFVKCMNDNRFVISMLARQSSKTTSVAAYILWFVTFQKGKSVAILANKEDAAKEVLSRIKMMHEELPFWLKMGVNEWNKKSIVLDNRSKVFCAATSPSGIRGKSCDLLYLDEYGIVKNTIADAFYASVFPTISSGNDTKCIITSTPLGYNHFWRMWTEAEKGINGYVPFTVPWHAVPTRDQKWFDEQVAALGEIKAAQEILLKFSGSSTTLLKGSTLDHLANTIDMPIETHEEGAYVEYEAPIKDHKYMITVDTSRGRHLDDSAFMVFDITNIPYKTVACYSNNDISPLLYPNLIKRAASRYNEAYILVEINDAGGQVADILWHELEYENMFWSNKDTLKNWTSKKPYPGLRTTTPVKRIGCETLKDLFESNKLTCGDAKAISQLGTFIQRTASYAADDGYKDDLVMCMVLFAWVTMQRLFKEITDSNIRLDMHGQKIEDINSKIPVVIYDDGSQKEIIPNNPHQIDWAWTNSEDLYWQMINGGGDR